MLNGVEAVSPLCSTIVEHTHAHIRPQKLTWRSLSGRERLFLVLKSSQSNFAKVLLLLNEGVVSKETVVLRRWGSSIQKFGFINGVDNVNWPPYRDSKS